MLIEECDNGEEEDEEMKCYEMKDIEVTNKTTVIACLIDVITKL